MDKYIHDDNNGLWYELQRDYYVPCVTAPEADYPLTSGAPEAAISERTQKWLVHRFTSFWEADRALAGD